MATRQTTKTRRTGKAVGRHARLVGLSLENFKCFGDSRQIELSGLNLVFGQNDSGKSTILQSLLLLSQSLESPGFEAALNLTGPLCPAGSFVDIVHGHDKKKTLAFELRIARRDGTATVRVDFSSDDPRPPRLLSLSIDSRDTRRNIEITRGRGYGGPYRLGVNATKPKGREATNLSFRAGTFLPIFGEEQPRRGRPSSTTTETRRWAAEVVENVVDILANMRALGPFRRAPERRYEYKGGGQSDIDITGRAVVDALI